MRLPGHSRHEDRRAEDSGPLRAGALRCEACGTTWFGHVAAHLASGWARCRRCGGSLHSERRGQRASTSISRVA